MEPIYGVRIRRVSIQLTLVFSAEHVNFDVVQGKPFDITAGLTKPRDKNAAVGLCGDVGNRHIVNCAGGRQRFAFGDLRFRFDIQGKGPHVDNLAAGIKFVGHIHDNVVDAHAVYDDAVPHAEPNAASGIVYGAVRECQVAHTRDHEGGFCGSKLAVGDIDVPAVTQHHNAVVAGLYVAVRYAYSGAIPKIDAVRVGTVFIVNPVDDRERASGDPSAVAEPYIPECAIPHLDIFDGDVLAVVEADHVRCTWQFDFPTQPLSQPAVVPEPRSVSIDGAPSVEDDVAGVLGIQEMLVVRIVIAQVGAAPDRTAGLEIKRHVVPHPEGSGEIVPWRKIQRSAAIACNVLDRPLNSIGVRGHSVSHGAERLYIERCGQPSYVHYSFPFFLFTHCRHGQVPAFKVFGHRPSPVKCYDGAEIGLTRYRGSLFIRMRYSIAKCHQPAGHVLNTRTAAVPQCFVRIEDFR